MREVARAAGVSLNAVSLALRGDPQIPEGTRRRIIAVAAELGYRKDPLLARALARARAGPETRFRATLALLNANEDPLAFTRHPTVPAYVAGCHRRARQLGYVLDEFWLADPLLDARAMGRVWRARGIEGAVAVGLMREDRLPEAARPLWREFPCVVTGVATREPALSFACADHHRLVLDAFRATVAAGYERPALVLDETIDRLTLGRFTGGFLVAQQSLRKHQRLRPFVRVAEARARPELFQRWLERERPDAILTLYHEVRRWLGAAGWRVPRDVGLVQLERRADHPGWAGMDQHNDVVGETAVEMLVAMIQGGVVGVPDFPRATLVGSSWVPGRTLPRRTKGQRMASRVFPLVS